MKLVLNEMKELWIWIQQPNPNHAWMSLILYKHEDNYFIRVANTKEKLELSFSNLGNIKRTYYGSAEEFSFSRDITLFPLLDMRKDNHLWIKPTDETEESREIIIDNEVRDIRVKSGNTIVKIRYLENGNISTIY
jgi:hypothetical protein